MVAHVPHYLVFDTTLAFHSLLSAWVSEFRFFHTFHYLTFSSHVVAYIVCFDSRPWSQKCDFMQHRYELFNACGDSYPSLRYLLHNINLTFSFIPLNPSFRVWIFSSHVEVYIVSFDSWSWTWKSDIIRPRYELFNACGGSCPSLPCHSHNITLPFYSFILAGVSELRYFLPMS